MKFTPQKIKLFTLLKLPAVYFTGVRVKDILKNEAIVVVKHRWVNQNPFKSIFWAVQGMAAELATGILVMKEISNSGKRVSMLVTNMNANFSKKATGKIVFSCNQGAEINKVIQKAVQTGEGKTIVLTSEGVNQDGVVVSKFEFEWSLKAK